MAIEREAKLTVPRDLRLPDLGGVREGVVATSPTLLQLDAVYYDTPELHLARSGVTLRHRAGESGLPWTLKLPADVAGSTMVRRELTFDGPSGEVPAAARDLVLAYVRSRPLAPVAELRTARTAVVLRGAGGEPLAEVVDDLVRVVKEGRLAGEFREVEVELRDDGRAAARVFDATVARLIEAGCRPEPPMSKLVRALGAAALSPPEVVAADVDADATAAELLCRALARSVAQVIRHDAGARLGDDPEDVHQLRVGGRRLRSDLRTFAPLLEQGWVSALRGELAWLGTEVGIVRDADVLADRLRVQGSTLAEEDTSAVTMLLERVASQRQEARATMLAALRSPRYSALLDDLVEAAANPVFAATARELAGQPARDVLADLVHRSWRRLDRAARSLGDDSPDEALHSVRILAKRCRYAAEAMAPVAGRRARRFAAAIEDLQTVLGDHHDTVVAETWLRAAASADPATAVAAGELIALQRLDRDRLGRAWPAVWKAARTKKLRKWLGAAPTT